MRRTTAVGPPVALFCAFLTATAGAEIDHSIQKRAGPIVCTGADHTIVINSQSGTTAHFRCGGTPASVDGADRQESTADALVTA